MSCFCKDPLGPCAGELPLDQSAAAAASAALLGARCPRRRCSSSRGAESQLVGTCLQTHPGHGCAQEDARKGICEHWKSPSTKRQVIAIAQLLQNRHLLQLGRCQSFTRTV